MIPSVHERYEKWKEGIVNIHGVNTTFRPEPFNGMVPHPLNNTVAVSLGEIVGEFDWNTGTGVIK